MKIAAITVNQTPMDWAKNVENILEGINSARDKKAQLVCFPELSICGYGCQDNFLGDWLWKHSLDQLITHILPHTEDLSVCIGSPIKYEDHLYNTVIYIKNKEIKYIIPKQNLANDGVHYEPRWFKAWVSGKQAFITIRGEEIPFGDYIIEDHQKKIAFEICEDAWRIERPGIEHAKRGVDIILNPSASHFALKKSESRQHLVINSSKQFNCLYVYVNLLGNEAGRMIYDGEMMFAEKGMLLHRNKILSFKDHQILLHDTENPDPTAKFKKSDVNREFHLAGALALYDYLRKSKSRGFVLSLSGGADSSTCAVLVSEMVKIGVSSLGVESFLKNIGHSALLSTVKNSKNIAQAISKEIFHTAYQGTKNSGDATLTSARELAEELGANFHHWLIDEEVDSYTSKIENALGRKLSWDTDDIALQNIQARARSPIIWMLANIKNALLLTTSNRSEGSVGYTTMDGDTSGSIAPIAAIDKPFIREWLKWAEVELNYKSLTYVNSLAPSAELRPNEQTQTDEADLMPYPTLQDIEQQAIQLHKSPVEVFNSLLAKYSDTKALKGHIHKFFTLWSRNQWKRERLAPSFHLDDYNVDPKTWCRFPILSSGFSEELKELEKMR